MAAAQVSLAKVVAERRFRADLCARLDGLTVSLPPLRARIEEVPHLFARLLRDHSGGHAPAVEPRLVEQLCLYGWPLNVRELDLLVRRLLTLHGQEPVLRRSHLPDRFFAEPREADDEPAARHPEALVAPRIPARTPRARRRDAAADATLLVEALREHGGNVARAAAAVGISRQRAYRLIEGPPGIDLAAFRADAGAGDLEAGKAIGP